MSCTFCRRAVNVTHASAFGDPWLKNKRKSENHKNAQIGRQGVVIVATAADGARREIKRFVVVTD
jgi:hypothetical protein